MYIYICTGSSHVCQMKRYVFTCFNFLGNCCSTWAVASSSNSNSNSTKAQICLCSLCVCVCAFVYMASLVYYKTSTPSEREGHILTYFSLLRVLFLSEMLNLLTAVVSYLIYFICGIYSSLLLLLLSASLDALGIQFLAFCFSCLRHGMAGASL